MCENMFFYHSRGKGSFPLNIEKIGQRKLSTDISMSISASFVDRLLV